MSGSDVYLVSQKASRAHEHVCAEARPAATALIAESLE